MSWKTFVIYILTPVVVTLGIWLGWERYQVCMELVDSKPYCMINAAVR